MDIKKYAYVVPTTSDDDSYAEDVYITSEIPEDLSWENIVKDAVDQHKGNPPMELPTRAYVIYHAAAKEVMKRTPFSFDSFAPDPDKKEISYEVIQYNTNIQDLREMDHHDCPELDEEGYILYEI